MHTDLSGLPHDLRSFIEKWGDGKRELTDLVSFEATTIKEHVTAAVNRAQAAQEARVLKHKQDERCQKLLRSLKYNGMNERRNDHHVHHPSTLQTIWDDDLDAELWGTFRDWLRSDEQVFWVSGKPGSGKTTMMKFFVSEPETQERLRFWNPDVIVVSHFIWLLGPEPMQRNLKGVFCSVIHQVLIAKPAIADYILGASDAVSLRENPTDWSLEELQGVWSAMMKNHSIPVCLFLDGLDEIDPKDGTGALLDILKDNFQPFPHVRLCMASRPEPMLRTRLGKAKYPSLALHDVNHREISRFVKSTLKCEGEVKHELEFQLIRKAHGVFLWIHLVLRNVNRALELGQEFDEVRQYINNLPEGLVDLYKSMWARMSKDERQVNSQKVALYFRLIIQARNDYLCFNTSTGIPAWLSVLQLALAVTPLRLAVLKSRNPSELSNQASIECEKITSDITNSCAGFLDVTILRPDSGNNWSSVRFARRQVAVAEQRTKVDFVHRSAVDFLVDTPEGRVILDQDRTASSRLQLDILESRLASLLLEAQPCFPEIPIGLQKYFLRNRFVGPKLASICFLSAVHDMLGFEMHQDVEDLLQACERLSNVPGDIPERDTVELLRLDFFSAAARLGHMEYTHRAVLDNRVPKSSMVSVLANLLVSGRILASPIATRLANLIIDAGVDIKERCYATHGFDSRFLPLPILAGPLEHLLLSLFRLIGDFAHPKQKRPFLVPCLYGDALDLIGTMIKAGTDVNGTVIFALRIREDNFPVLDLHYDKYRAQVWIEVPMKSIIRFTANCLLLDCHMRSPDTTRDVREACISLATLLEDADRFLEPELVHLIESHHSDREERDLVSQEGEQLARLARNILHLDTQGDSASLQHQVHDIIKRRRNMAYEDYSKRLVWIESDTQTYNDAFWKAVEGWQAWVWSSLYSPTSSNDTTIIWPALFRVQPFYKNHVARSLVISPDVSYHFHLSHCSRAASFCVNSIPKQPQDTTVHPSPVRSPGP